MDSKLLNETDGFKTYAVIFETGDEVMAGLKDFAAKSSLTAASFKAIGAFERSKLAFFDWEEKSYLKFNVDEQVEVASLTGDIAIGPDGEPQFHVHVVLGTRDGSAIAGHLVEAIVRPTLEVILTETPAHLRKRYNPEVGLTLIDPSL